MVIKQYKDVAKLIRDTDVYKVYDLTTLQNLSLSLTELHPEQETGGHSHIEADEVYIFVSGKGEIQIGDTMFPVTEGETFIIPRGDFHKVFNKSREELIFWSIFEKYGNRK